MDHDKTNHNPDHDTNTSPVNLEDHDNYDQPATDVHINRDYVQHIQDMLHENDRVGICAEIEHLHAADVADLLEVMSSKERLRLIEFIGDRLAPDVLAEIEGEAQDELYEHIPNEQIADAVTDLETDDAVYVLEELDADDREEVLKALAVDDRVAIEESLSYPEDSAGRMMQRDLVALPEFWTVGQTIDYLRSDNADVPDDFYDIFVVDPGHKPVGSVPLSRVMRTARDKTIGSIMDDELYLIQVDADQEEVAYQFTKYHLISTAVVDESRRLVGVITVDDVVDVIDEEAEQDILALAGVGGDAGLNESIREITRSRFGWLIINLGTAILASLVIGLFDATIEQMVALAILMPIVASMGGNAGTQTMTVAVRAIATKELSRSNAFRSIRRELYVAALNGLVIAIVSGLVAWVWQANIELAIVFAIAMIVNMLVAGLFGILIPLGLNRAGADPAISSSVFVTTITDVVGFFAFLGLAYAFLIN